VRRVLGEFVPLTYRDVRAGCSATVSPASARLPARCRGQAFRRL